VVECVIPYTSGDLLAEVHKVGTIIAEDYQEDGTHVTGAATRCNTLQHTATHSLLTTLQHTATHCNTLIADDYQEDGTYVTGIATHNSILQHTAAYCNTQ